MFKVGDFVYFTEFSKYEEIEDKYGYGIILEIKDLPKSFEEGTERFAIIQVKYFEDGTPCEFDSKEVVKIKLVEDAEIAIERHERELHRQLDNMKNIRKEFINV